MDQKKHGITPFPFGWDSFLSPGYHAGDGSYDNLPPLPKDQFIGKLQWLTPLDNELDAYIHGSRPPAKQRAEQTPPWIDNMKDLVASVHQLGLSLPDPFLQLMASSELQDRIPSCTDCYFGLSSLAPCPGSKDGYVIRFLNDSQGCIMWHLYLSPIGEECVLASYTWLDLVHTNPEYVGHITEEEAIEQTYVCAPSFEAFLYRFWIENLILFNLAKRIPLSEEQQQYLAYYIPREEQQRYPSHYTVNQELQRYLSYYRHKRE